MDIKDIALEYVSISGLDSTSIDNVRHVKVLPYLSVVQAVTGDYDIALGDDACHNTGDGGFFVAPANVRQTIVHNADKASGRMVCRWVFLKVKINGVHYLDELYRFPTVLPEDVRRDMNAVFDTLFASDDTTEKYICYYRILQLLLSVATETEHPLPSYIGGATTFMHEHYAQKIAVSDVARHVGLSESRFFSVFKKQMGMSPIAYLNNYRLSLAVEWLSQTDETVTEIAARVGIPDAVYFNKIFKKNYQMSPTEYRTHYGVTHKPTATPAPCLKGEI